MFRATCKKVPCGHDRSGSLRPGSRPYSSRLPGLVMPVGSAMGMFAAVLRMCGSMRRVGLRSDAVPP